jgi:hypothetical protein
LAQTGQGPRSRSRKPPDKFLFGTPEEIDNRTETLYTEFKPADNAPAFVQIKPESSSGQSVNRAPLQGKSGNYKFAGGPGVP